MMNLAQIKHAPSANLALVRPTKHFKILTPDNPYMQSILDLEQELIDQILQTSSKPLTSEEKKAKEAALKQAITESLAKKAYDEQLQLITQLSEHGILVQQLEEGIQTNSKTPDYYTQQVFVTDTGAFCTIQNNLHFIPAIFKNPSRQGEEELAISFAKTMGAKIHSLNPLSQSNIYFEGGDARQAFGREILFIGYGFRTSIEAIQQIAEFNLLPMIPIKLCQPEFYHLDCCFLPLPFDAAVIYEGEYELNQHGEFCMDELGWPKIIEGTETMDAQSRAQIRSLYDETKLILLTKAEALAFATNAAIFQSKTDGRFKLFVNGNRQAHLLEESNQEAIALQQNIISYSEKHLHQIIEITNHQMDIIEIPYQTMHLSGGSIRCTIQEVAII